MGVISRCMAFYKVALLFAVYTLVMTVGVVMMANGSPWLLIGGFLVTLLAFSKYGCLDH